MLKAYRYVSTKYPHLIFDFLSMLLKTASFFTVLSFEENGVYFVFFSMRFERIPFFILNSTKAYR